jgi:hypothetical protein
MPAKIPWSVDGPERDGLLSREDYPVPHAQGIMEQISLAVLAEIPLGFEDETGFHFGSESLPA